MKRVTETDREKTYNNNKGKINGRVNGGDPEIRVVVATDLNQQQHSLTDGDWLTQTQTESR